MSKVLSILRHWLPMAALAIAVCGLVYLAVQQALRQTANDPQIQMAEDGSAAFAQGEAVETILPASNVDLARSLAPFVMVFDDAGTVLGSSGMLHGQDPVLPGGVLDYTRQQGQD